jgi:hypothetical protein
MVSGSLPATSQPIIFQQEAKLAKSAFDNLIPALLDDNSETRERTFNNLRGLVADVVLTSYEASFSLYFSNFLSRT